MMPVYRIAHICDAVQAVVIELVSLRKVNEMKSFSQRQGLKPTAEVIQLGAMSDELRNSLWNALDATLWSRSGFVFGARGSYGEIEELSRSMWSYHFKEPVDSRPGYGFPDRGGRILKEIRTRFFGFRWNEVYDFLEFVVGYYSKEKPRLGDLFNMTLERELSGYRFIEGILTNVTDAQEIEMLKEALADTKFATVSAHLERALQLLSDRTNPDYRNSIKESISAVEAIACIALGNAKATLTEALKILEKKGHLHPALKDGFTKLYGYTSDSDGIRHAMLEESDVDQSDAKYFLMSCTAFIGYLKANLF
jgi:hypothetical protein